MANRSKHGLTLVELLTVVGIVAVLAALILPSVKTLLSDRKSSQAAIMVKNFIEGARARAIGKNRSVSVVLERLSSRPSDVNLDGLINLADTSRPGSVYDEKRFVSATASSFEPSSRTTVDPDANFIPYNSCIKLSLAEEPIPISESTLPVLTAIHTRYAGDIRTATSPIPVPYEARRPLGSSSATEIRILEAEVASGTAAGLLGDYLVYGNEISFNDSSVRFTIVSPSSRAAHDSYATTSPARVFFAVMNELAPTSAEELALKPYVELPANKAYNKFRIYQKPKPIYSQSLQLPKGTCIDLSLSGFASNRAGLSDYRVRFASDWVRSGGLGVPTPEELRPIQLVFSADGSLSEVYANQIGSEQSTRIDCVDDVFLHVGLIDQVVLPFDASRLRTGAAFVQALNNGVKMNLSDSSSYVLRLSPKSGAITAAPQAQLIPDPNDNLFDVIEKSRSNAYTSTLTGQ